MARWYVKDLSKLSKVSVRTLHHYDQIGLLKPLLRAANGYRVYSEKDLSKLQQIVALKFCGFDLIQIKTLLAKADAPVHKHLSAQVEFLKGKAEALAKAIQTLEGIISDCKHTESVICKWENIVKSFGVYNMMNELEKTAWGKLLTPEQLKKIAIYTEKNKSQQDNKPCLFAEAKTLINEDPTGEIGQTFAAKWKAASETAAQSMDEEVRTILTDTLKSGKLQRDATTMQESLKVGEWLGKALEHAEKKPLTPEELSAIKTELQNISVETMQGYFADLQAPYDELTTHFNEDPYGTNAQEALKKWTQACNKHVDLSLILLKAQKQGLYTPPKNVDWLNAAQNPAIGEWMKKAAIFLSSGTKI